MHTPIALFIYKRPDHTENVIKSLMMCERFDDTNIYVFADGPRNNEEHRAVSKTRNIARDILGIKATYIESDRNIGLANSITLGVDQLCNKYGRVVVLEDDLLVSRYFLRYMNEALERYEHDTSVMQISGYMFPIDSVSLSSKCSFLPLTTSWGWGTWKRAWDNYDPEAKGWELLLSDSSIKARFNLSGSYDYAWMLKNQMQGYIDSWAIRWYWSVFRRNGLVLYPPASLIRNIGLDGSGTHGSRTYQHALTQETLPDVTKFTYPDQIVVDSERLNAVTRYLHMAGNTPLARAKRLLSKIGLVK
jgi:hypothetical protein